MTALEVAEFLAHRMGAAELTAEGLAARSELPLRTVLCYVEHKHHADLEAAARVLSLFEIVGVTLRRHPKIRPPHKRKPFPPHLHRLP